MTLQQVVDAEKAKGKSALDIHKMLRDQNAGIPWAEVKIAYNKGNKPANR